MEEKRFLTAADVTEVMECSKSRAYEIIKKLNAELEEKHYITIHGKVNAKYFYERIYNGKGATVNNGE